MEYIPIEVGGYWAKALAKALETSEEQLDKMDGEDGEIYIKLLSEKMKDRIKGGDICTFRKTEKEEVSGTMYFVDNGDGKIGKGDLLLHWDQHCYKTGGGCCLVGQLAKLFETRKTEKQKVSGKKIKWNDCVESFYARHVLPAIEENRGETINAVRGVLSRVCRQREVELSVILLCQVCKD